MSKIRLSASKLKTYSSCSWIYYNTYHTDFPRTSNDGSSRGSVVHYILECLIDSRRRKHVELILATSDPFASLSVKRLILIHAKKLKVADESNLAMIKEFILTALRGDFYHEGAEKVIAEHKFSIEGKNYSIIGFIDVIAVYSDYVRIVDYKSSKAKFPKEELDYNLQNLIYCLAIRKMYPDKPVHLIFKFLKFKRAPDQAAPLVSDHQLAGFEQYLEYVSEQLKDFTLDKAKLNLAKDDIKRSWLCGKVGTKDDGTDKFCCQHRHPRIYWVLNDENGKYVDSSFEKKSLDNQKKPGYSIEMKTSPGCPAYKNEWS